MNIIPVVGHYIQSEWKGDKSGTLDTSLLFHFALAPPGLGFDLKTEFPKMRSSVPIACGIRIEYSLHRELGKWEKD